MPEIFEVVARTGFLREDMKHAVKVVEHGPADITRTVRIDGQERLVVLEAQVDLLGDRFGLALVASRADHQVIRVGDKLTHVEANNVLAQLAIHQPGDFPAQFFTAFCHTGFHCQ